MSLSEPVFVDSSDGTLVPSYAIDNSVNNSAGNTVTPSSPIIAPRLPVELLMCICDFLPNRRDIVNLSATCQELRGELYYTLVHRDLRSGRLITLKYGLQTRNIRVIKPFLNRYRHLITRLTVTPKKKEVTPNKKAITGEVPAREVVPKRVNDPQNDTDKAGTINQTVLPVRTRVPSPSKTIISFRDEYLPSLRLIRPLLTSALEEALLAHDLTFAEELLWHGNKDLIPSLTPVLESVLWSAFNPKTSRYTGEALDHRPDHRCADPGPISPIVWTWKTCPVAAVKLLMKFGAKGNRAGVWAEGKKIRKRRREWFSGNGGNGGSIINNDSSLNSPSEEDETPETTDAYDGYFHPRTQTHAAHVHQPAMPPNRLWTGLELVAYLYQETCERAAAAQAADVGVAVAAPATATAGSADSGADVGPAAASAGAAPVAKNRGIKRNFSGSFRNPSSGSQPSPGAGKEHGFFPVTCEHHVERGEGGCLKQLIEVLSDSVAHGEILRVTSLSSNGHARVPKTPLLEHDLDNMLKLTEITVPFVKMLINEQAGKLFQEIFEEAEKRISERLDGLMERRTRLEKNKKMKTESMTKTQFGGGEEDEDFWLEEQELDLDEGEPEEGNPEEEEDDEE
ncbi:hypothetical protein NEUTE1DRAFT_139866 [Neurospora tetrasperma FGSC 2508]|uniref:F-box domain-containing protein n=1 Tax=Neurospora tetrasperma (strain FGSC 2508 / ATCC MYA-4615 / P0657) TaxID=510951 RepID=F8MUD5_NEUT8|nr:uncharacterized protein NEUTE1DRAFT_139866 [Neurospora tetrasperma FGSC 2508]EGO55617.1 hypothetical protein NEUTE1DRAFT_139866 [Neurospora tetrasperma FGSC 2508]EGZ69139.1 hypothetical protein NEUTE2DRAFT_72690 [Neurospora tetrasperma FGSC 2509]